MRKSVYLTVFVFLCSWSLLSEAKLSDNAAMKCISGDKVTRSAFLDLEQAYEMRSVSAKDFFQAFEKAPSCPSLRKNLQKLRTDLIARMPTPSLKAPRFESMAPAENEMAPPGIAPGNTPGNTSGNTPGNTQGFAEDPESAFFE